MASVLKLFRDILCKLHFTRRFIHHSFGRWALFLAFLGRRLGVWRPWSDGERGATGTFQKAEEAERSSPGTGSLDSREHVVAASYIPASASRLGGMVTALILVAIGGTVLMVLMTVFLVFVGIGVDGIICCIIHCDGIWVVGIGDGIRSVDASWYRM